MQFSVVVPAHNEEDGLDIVLTKLEEVIKVNNYEAEIIVVDDGSTDDTSKIAAKRNVRLIKNSTHQGYGISLKIGIKQTIFNTIVIIDADDSYSPYDIPLLVEDIQNFDMVIGSRKFNKNISEIFRRIPKFFLRKISNFIMNENIPDLNSGLRVFKKDKYEKYKNLLSDNFSFTLTITLSYLSNYEIIKFVPISYVARKGTSKIRPFYDTVNFIMLIFKIIIYFNPLRVFLPVGSFFILSSFVIAFYSFFITGCVWDVTTIVSFIIGILIIIMGFLADLINQRLK